MDTGGWRLHGGCPTNRFWHFDGLEEIDYFNDFLYKEIRARLNVLYHQPSKFWKNKKISGFDRIYANGQTAGQCGTPHTDDGDLTFLYYPNPEWGTDYQGHLIFLNTADSEVDRIVEYKSNRALLFDGKVPHYADAPSRCYNDLRISLAYKLRGEHG